MTPPPSLQDLIDTVRHDTSGDSALDELTTAATTVAQIEDTSDALLGHFVDRCRREGRSWSEISAALGVTKQAVHKRFAASVADQIIASIPSPTMERFTARARVVIASAALAARDAGRAKAGSEHILVGCDPHWCLDYDALDESIADPWLAYALQNSEPMSDADLGAAATLWKIACRSRSLRSRARVDSPACGSRAGARTTPRHQLANNRGGIGIAAH